MILSYPFFKSVIDRFLAFLLLVFLSPFLFLIFFCVLFCIGSPVFFRQLRPGYMERPFFLYKFRTMTNARDLSGTLLPDCDRLTPFGLWLRKTSIDELPALINILRGELSFIGPRPLLVQYLPLYSLEQSRRHNVIPGFSGWAQINGRNAITWEKKFLLDVWYVDHQSFGLDLWILLLTIWTVIRRHGITPNGQTTMPPFLGSSIDE